jgi:hypothetical protein
MAVGHAAWLWRLQGNRIDEDLLAALMARKPVATRTG